MQASTSTQMSDCMGGSVARTAAAGAADAGR